MRELYKFLQSIPVPIVIALLTILLFLVGLYITKIKIPSWKMRLEDIQDFRTKTPRKIEKLEKRERKGLHNELAKILDECFDKGYKNRFDIYLWGENMSEYIEFGGNHDGELLQKEFEKIPFATETVIKKTLGNKEKIKN